MKKYLITLTLICLLALLPSNAYALVELDENGKVIQRETQDGEYTILMEPDTGGQDGNSSSSDVITPEDKVISSDENDKAVSSDDNINAYDGDYRDDIYTTTAQEDAELLANKEEDNKNNDSLIIIISSIIGVSLGSVGTYLFMLKRR